MFLITLRTRIEKESLDALFVSQNPKLYKSPFLQQSTPLYQQSSYLHWIGPKADSAYKLWCQMSIFIVCHLFPLAATETTSTGDFWLKNILLKLLN